MMSANFSDFSTPLPPCHIQNSGNLVPFVCFLGSPSPNPLRTSYKYAPLRAGRLHHPRVGHRLLHVLEHPQLARDRHGEVLVDSRDQLPDLRGIG